MDFDIIRSAIDWTEDQNAGSIWSSIILNQTKSDVVVPPGSPSELIKHVSFRRRSAARKNNSPISAEFIRLISGEEANASDNLDTSYHNSLQAFIQSAIGEKAFFLIKKIRENFKPIPEVKDVDELKTQFKRALRFLSEKPMRETRDENNRIDALNFAVIKEFNSQKNRELCVLVSGTNVVHELGGAWPEEIYDEPRIYNPIWSARKAAIYIMLLQKEGTLAGAERQSWNIIQEIVELRRKLRFRSKDSQFEEIRQEKIPRSEFLGALTSFEELFNYIKNDQSVVESIYVGDEIRYNLNDQKLFFQKFESFLRDNLKLTQYKNALDLINEASTVVKNMQIVDHGPSGNLGYLSKREYFVNNVIICTRADFTQRVLWVVHSSAPLVEFVTTVNNIRAEIRAQIATKSLTIENPEDGAFEITVKTGTDFQTRECRLDGRRLALTGFHETGIASEDCVEVRTLFDGATRLDYRFFRVDSQHFAASYEGKYKLFNIDKRLSAVTNFFVQGLARPEASQYDFEANAGTIKLVRNDVSGNTNKKPRKS